MTSVHVDLVKLFFEPAFMQIHEGVGAESENRVTVLSAASADDPGARLERQLRMKIAPFGIESRYNPAETCTESLTSAYLNR